MARALRVGGAKGLEQLGLGGEPIDQAVGGRIGGERPEQRRLLAERAEVAERLTAAREHHREVADDDAGIVAAAALAHAPEPARERPGEARLVGDLAEQRAAGVGDQSLSVRGDFYVYRATISLHLQGEAS